MGGLLWAIASHPKKAPPQPFWGWVEWGLAWPRRHSMSSNVNLSVYTAAGYIWQRSWQRYLWQRFGGGKGCFRGKGYGKGHCSCFALNLCHGFATGTFAITFAITFATGTFAICTCGTWCSLGASSAGCLVVGGCVASHTPTQSISIMSLQLEWCAAGLSVSGLWFVFVPSLPCHARKNYEELRGCLFKEGVQLYELDYCQVHKKQCRRLPCPGTGHGLTISVAGSPCPDWSIFGKGGQGRRRVGASVRSAVSRLHSGCMGSEF